ncbi:kinase-like domain-containing protein [Rhizophagus irregularis DAOM 181602=DAOM 197198]|nr:kinase-like domain-containing protein [Rhizophagus irregularis DAOM 181602=DAOM 197198]
MSNNPEPKDITKEIVNELKLQREVDFHENIIRFYGITTEIQCDNSKKYLLMMEYADSGTLRNYLSERFENLTWNGKLNLAFQLADAISYLHDKEIMYYDLHSNNILVQRNIIKLSDFGLSKRNEMVAYVDPQIFIRNNDKKCDIYSTGVLLWEISSGKSPLCKKPHDVSPITPEDYVKIYTDCLNNDPNDRPTINQIAGKINAIILKENVQVSSKQQNINIINNSLHEEMFQIVQNFSKVNIKEIEPLVSSNLIINDFEIIIEEIILLLENIGAVDKQKAFELYQKAANTGHAFGITSLGYCYHYGIGTNIDHQKTFKLYQKTANLGNPRGLYNLGVCYNNGVGTCIDKQKAFKLFQESANLGNLLGMSGLEYCYSYGFGNQF